jgi:acetate kinase
MTVGKILVVNSGSSSVKFKLFEAAKGLTALISGLIERVGLPEASSVTVQVQFHGQA